MAKYNAIYEGRLPRGIRISFIGDENVVSHHGFVCYLMDSAINIYRKCTGFFKGGLVKPQ
jgi:hypothetical protein